jgi:hypothetical protein
MVTVPSAALDVMKQGVLAATPAQPLTIESAKCDLEFGINRSTTSYAAAMVPLSCGVGKAPTLVLRRIANNIVIGARNTPNQNLSAISSQVYFYFFFF